MSLKCKFFVRFITYSQKITKFVLYNIVVKHILYLFLWQRKLHLMPNRLKKS